MSKVALVTGGTRGIGEAISEKLNSDGFSVVANYSSNDEAAQKFAKKTGIEVSKWDVSSFESCQKGVNEIFEKYQQIDVLVNNAGITRDAPFHKMSLENWKKVIDVNLNSIFNITSQVINKMRENNFGRIIHISSVNGQKGQFGQTNYSATKSALIGFSKSLALEGAAKNITSNVISPGYINTEMVAAIREDILKSIIETIPAKRLGHSIEIAEMVSYLASDKASYINGATLSVNGGLWMD
ncbi:MAG: beta-ketoacyl-ACP reductase [Rickettsiales bacterium]|nr:beta-ketoacyl-ACP reductase [Rickettsiales bacterium]|tara:strand:- start:469 stop:1191 length:723 start_codon:yes stop_codon:yes gene_type:complete